MRNDISLEQLRVLDAVVRTGSFSAAAKEIGRTQSSVSHAAKILEELLSVSIFDRSKKKPTLTEAGNAIHKNALRILNNVNELHACVDSISEDVESELAIVVEDSVPNTVLMDSIKSFQSIFPHTSISLYSDGAPNAEEYLQDGRAQIAIYPINLTEYSQALVKELVVVFPFVPVVSVNHPLAKIKGVINSAQLEDSIALKLTPKSLQSPIESRQKWMFTNQSTRLEYILEGFGWGIMPLHLVEKHILSGELVHIKLQEMAEFSYPLHAVYLRSHPPGRAGRWLINDLTKKLLDRFE